ncbi:AlpA family transcriptional regulator [Blastococcus sp. URHD0036]|uniref:helix-turn-helix transcriptional regulator n=1 Tax=Blastococcus sp. URHD0036 TaxID=1380356 RepID=UPI0004966AEE|nr:helix-turn-helix domain-containing protein [Blastococcus sp. URHD0036]
MPHADEPRFGNDLMTLAETAAYLRTPVATVRYWRHLGIGPAGFRLGRRVIYRRAEVDRWLCQRQATDGQ